VITIVAVVVGGLAAAPFVSIARRELVTARVRTLGGRTASRSTIFTRHAHKVRRGMEMGMFVRVVGAPGRRRRLRRHEAVIRRELPIVVDLVGVGLAAGCTPFHSLEHSARFGPRATAEALRGVLQACARGRSFDDALRELGSAIAMLRPLADALRTSARLGTPAAPALSRLAAEVRADVRRRAEARARTVPVRLCFPLVLCVLPAFGLLTVVPVVLGGLRS
jgi:Flp pilus assembly protein TadB